MTHDRNCRTAERYAPRRSTALLGLAVALAWTACSSSPTQVPSEWPPQDFRLVVEELGEGEVGSVVVRRFSARADGECVYGLSSAPLIDPVSRTAVPVFSDLCAYRLRPECTRLLARKLHRRKILEIDEQQGDGLETDGKSLRLHYQAFGRERVFVASGQIHGAFVELLHVVNAYLPPGETFALPGMVGDPELSTLSGVPSPVEGLIGALDFHETLLETRPDDQELLVDTFALACRAGERAKAEQLLRRWTEVSALQASPDAPFSYPPRLLPAMLQRMLPK